MAHLQAVRGLVDQISRVIAPATAAPSFHSNGHIGREEHTAPSQPLDVADARLDELIGQLEQEIALAWLDDLPPRQSADDILDDHQLHAARSFIRALFAAQGRTVDFSEVLREANELRISLGVEAVGTENHMRTRKKEPWVPSVIKFPFDRPIGNDPPSPEAVSRDDDLQRPHHVSEADFKEAYARVGHDPLFPEKPKQSVPPPERKIPRRLERIQTTAIPTASVRDEQEPPHKKSRTE